MREALLYRKLAGKKVRCGVCQKKCFIADGKIGYCGTRINQKGRLFSLLYGRIAGFQIDPIEKKPFYHFKPGSLVASSGSFGCNFRCRQCLNWFESQKTDHLTFPFQSIPPQEIIDLTLKNHCPGIAFTFNEPVIWLEYVLDIAKLAKKKGLFTVFVTNGSWTKATIDKLAGLIDAANIDFKGFSEKTYQKQGAFFGEIPEMAAYAKKKGIFLEITTLLIPDINDNANELAKMTTWIKNNLGPDTPWHLSQFDPALAPDPEFKKIPATSIQQLEKAAVIGQKAGLNHIYIWAAASGYDRSNTICPKCKKNVIKRDGWQVEKIDTNKDGSCRLCGYKLNLIL